ncbi:MAG: hypothetical protein AAFY17_16385 [Cyanobacteria bacterium J06642_11]
MILSRICRPEFRAELATGISRGLLLLVVVGSGGCGPKQPDIPNEVEAIAHRCYVALATSERTPKLEPAKAMEDGTFLILWSMAEAQNERGSCNVDGRGTVLLLTNNGDVQAAPTEPPSEVQTTPAEASGTPPTPPTIPPTEE